MTYNQETDAELFHVLRFAGPGAYWTTNCSARDWKGNTVMVLAPCETRERWQVNWTATGVRGCEAHGDTPAEACASLVRCCPFPIVLATLVAHVQAQFYGHPVATERVVLDAAL